MVSRDSLREVTCDNRSAGLSLGWYKKIAGAEYADGKETDCKNVGKKRWQRRLPQRPDAKPRPLPFAPAAAPKVCRRRPSQRRLRSQRSRVQSRSANPTPAKLSKAPPVSVPPEVELANVDEQLVALLNKRTSLYLQKMKGVETPSKIVFSDLDQQQVWGMIDRCNHGPLTSAEIKTVFRPLMSAGRQRIKSIRVAYLGPAYSFTHQAAIANDSVKVLTWCLSVRLRQCLKK